MSEINLLLMIVASTIILAYPRFQNKISPLLPKKEMSDQNESQRFPLNSSSAHEPNSIGISALQINKAREMVNLHTRDRRPNLLTTTSDLHSRIAAQKKLQQPEIRSSREANTSFVAPQSLFLSQLTAPSRVQVPARNHTGQCKNPQCAGCGTVIIPLPKASFPFHEKPSITVNDWSIYTVKGPICLSEELDHLNDTRYDFPLPEMIFGNNCVRLVHDPTGGVIEFNTLDALDSLANKADFKVAYYKEWLSTRPKAQSSEDANQSVRSEADLAGLQLSTSELDCLTPDLELVKPYDWTYSTNYKGTISNLQFIESHEEIPIDRLLRQDPILFFDESVLFEDELGDNGITILSTKIRVMHTCLLLLCRLFMRVDDVAFRIRDTRVFIDLEKNTVIREYKMQQELFEEVLKKVSGRTSDPKKLFRDSNWVSQSIPVLKRELETMVFEESTK